MSPAKPKHKQAHEAVNTPPSRNPDLMRRIYTLLTKCRAASPDHRGLEATLVGSFMGLLPEDTLIVSHAASLPEILFATLRPELLDLAPLDPKAPELTPAAHIAMAAGYALHRAIHHKPGLVMAFAGETESLHDTRETLSFAVTHKLPLVLVVQHNLARLKNNAPVPDLTFEVLETDMAGMTVDGSDAMAVYRVTQEAMFRARHESGPTLIECKTYRKRNVPRRLHPWVQGDAVAYMERQLRARDFWHESLRHD